MISTTAHPTSHRSHQHSPARTALAALAVAVCGTLLTAVGAGAGQAAHLGEAGQVWVLAVFAAASAVVGWGLMRRRGLHGLAAPRDLRSALYAAPLVATLPVVLLTGGVHVGAPLALAYAALTVAVGFNEEIWFRGLLPATLAPLGARASLWGSAALFGFLHLANALQISDGRYLALQVAYAFVVGVVLLLVVRRTGSLWIGIAWHAAYDFLSYLGGDRLTTATVLGLGAVVALLVGYAAWMGRGQAG